ncbi:hypothetical protein L288_12880, partial [Sphingobium quisquiliarum P25]
DDAPRALADSDGVSEDGPLVADGNVLTGIGGSDANGSDGVADVQGADGAAISSAGTFKGVYGTLTLEASGLYSYRLDNENPLVQTLSPGETLTDSFSYSITDGDGDVSSSTLTITISGSDDGVGISGLDGEGAEVLVSEAHLADGSAPDAAALTRTGSFSISTPDGLAAASVEGVSIFAGGAFKAAAIVTAEGTLRITGFTPVTGPDGSVTGGSFAYSYELTGNSLAHGQPGTDSILQSFTVTVTDGDGSADSASLDVRISDDIPDARDDSAVISGSATSVAVDVSGNDVSGADGLGSVTFASTAGIYGDLVSQPDGSRHYVLNAAGLAKIAALAPGASVIDSFAYSLTDGDGDKDSATLTISLVGADDPVSVTGLTAGGDVVVDEDDLIAGTDGDKEPLTQTGDFTISAPDGVDSLLIDGHAVISAGVFSQVSFISPLGNRLEITGYDPVNGKVSYSYTLLGAEQHPAGGGENALIETFPIILTDTDGDSSPANLEVKIIDDVPVAAPETAGVAVGATSFNIGLILDFSGSIDKGELNVMLSAVKGAMGDLFATSTVTVSLTVFSNEAMSFGPFTSYAALEAQIDALNPTAGGTRPYNGGTNYSAAITEAMESFAPDPSANNQIFFLSDGNPNQHTGTGGHSLADAVASVWESFVADNDITISTVGVGAEVNSPRLQDVDVDGEGAPILVDDFAALVDALGEIVGNLGASGNLLANDHLGADGGRLLSITVDGVVYTWDGASSIIKSGAASGVISGHQLLIDTSAGGRLTLDFASGAWTYARPNGGEAADERFDYSIIDNDGDKAQSSLTLTAQPDSAPVTAAVFATLDEDGLPGGTAGGTGDYTGASGEAQVSGTLGIAYGADGPGLYGPGGTGTVSFAAMHNLTAVVGVETVRYSWAGATHTLSAIVDGGARAGTTLFEVQITDALTGAYKATLVNNVLHAGGADENDAGPVNLTYRVGDGNGTVSAGVLTLTIDDDTPSLGSIQNGFASSNANAAAAVGVLHLHAGPDGTGAVTDVTILSSDMQSGSRPILGQLEGNIFTAYRDSNNNGLLEVSEKSASNSVFTLKIDPAGGSSGLYTFDLTRAINNPDTGATVTFAVTLTDGDGDAVTGNFSVNVKQGNTPSSPVAPVVFDLDGDGISFLSSSAGVLHDYYGTGAVPTAWISPADGLLARWSGGRFDIVFSDDAPGAVSDLDGVRLAYDSNGDGVLNAADSSYATLGIWQDANSNGLVDAGEYQALATRGIVSIGLVTSGPGFSAANGDVDVTGTASFVRSDGTAGMLADAIFATGRAASLFQQERHSFTSQNQALVAAGLVAVSGVGVVGEEGSAPVLAAEAAIVAEPVQAGMAALEPVEVEEGRAAPLAPAGDRSEHIEPSVPQRGHGGEEAVVDHASLGDGDDAAAASPDGPEAPQPDLGDHGGLLAQSVELPGFDGTAAVLAAAAQETGPGQVVQVVGEALGTAAGPDIDALLAALPGGDHAPAPLLFNVLAVEPVVDAGHMAAAAAVFDAALAAHEAVAAAHG